MFSVAFSPDGRQIVSGSWDNTIRVWRSDGQGEPLVLRGHQGSVTSVAFSPDGGRSSRGRTTRRSGYGGATGRRAAGPAWS